MTIGRIPGIVKRVADTATSDEALKNTDGAVDALIASLITIENNLQYIKPQSPAQQAALDEMQSVFDEALKPYSADFAKAIELFGG